ncbi:hypothetical protein LPJ66_005770 [Kickxella alabastrina]|uniref:Uncharacterized protein n=1 Tax=Kickxella alabastrina TaxID=61397 RepID=A0ACC1IEB0_9FUNG|nr:hypothetical protein LPJ66_005770 [Kickxella alabastrina]
MGFFRRTTSKSKDGSQGAPTTQRYLDAGRQVAAAAATTTPNSNKQQSHGSDMYDRDDARSYVNVDGDGATYEQGRPYQKHEHYYQEPHSVGISTMRTKDAFNRDEEGDFDDAASYHSTSSNPGMARPTTAGASASAPAAAYAGDTGYTQTLPSRYLQMATQGRGGARGNNAIIDSYYSTFGDDDNVARTMGQMSLSANARQMQQQQQQPRQQYQPAHHIQPSLSSGGMVSSAAANGGAIRSPAMQTEPRQKSEQELGEDCFQKAVNFHELGDLVSATAYFKRAADKHNPLGMLFYGLSLRHGWGCQPNENLAFVFLQKAGEQVVPHVKDMDPAVAGMAKDELAMAIYELGQSYRHGWGVSQNKKTAAYYFEVAAELGDADAQGDLAACYEKGDGVKRDMKRAAHYYRLANKQGMELFGTSWIYKKKYDSD